MDLLLEIARCPNVDYCLTHPNSDDPCAQIVSSQGFSSRADYQVPEPWSGHLERVPILFLASNPSISIEEDYPVESWSDEEIADYFSNRFGGGRKPWIRDGRYWLAKDGSHTRRPVAFWSAIRQRPAELSERDVANVRPGMDYSTAEVVHCKSRSEIGVKAAFDTCVDRYLQRMVAQSGAVVIVSLGTHAARAVQRVFAVPHASTTHGPVRVGERDRMFAFLPHPNAFKPKTFANCLPADDLARVRAFLRS